MERRTVLKAAAAAPVLLWVTPVVETLVPSRAYAGSAKPKPPKPRVESSQLPTPTPAVAVETGQLPYTGDNELREAALGAAALVAGAVVVAKTREPRTL